jgi:hypothetical protein
VLKNELPTRMYNHFLIFHVAIKILATEGLCKEFNQYAKELLHLFVGQAKELYGKISFIQRTQSYSFSERR